MAEYIEREAAIKAIDNEVSLDGLYANIKAVPAADVRPERHARWIERRGYNIPLDVYEVSYYCGCCSNMVYKKYNFCPCCGAKMDGKDGESNG